MFFRFGGPALLFGATGPGPFGKTWIEVGQKGTPLLDADIRFFGALMLGIGLIMLSMMRDVKKHTVLLRIVAGSVFLGALARIYSLFAIGSAGVSGTIPIVIELTGPVVLVWLQASICAKESLGD